LGIGAAVPIGAINILMMNTALKTYKGALFIGFGAMSSDITYLLLILLGMATFLDNPTITTTLGVLGSGFLFYMAYMIFKSRAKEVDTKAKTVSKKGLLKFYAQGYVLTFINPYTIAFWLSIAGFIANKSLEPIYTLFGMLNAILLWITLMPYFVHKSKHKISNKVSYWINVFSSGLLGIFAISLLYSLFL
jgi:L-lysine exporter family protein LysE/ArgO